MLPYFAKDVTKLKICGGACLGLVRRALSLVTSESEGDSTDTHRGEGNMAMKAGLE